MAPKRNVNDPGLLPVPPATNADDVPPRASVLIVGWRDARLLAECVESLLASAAKVSYEVLVVLNEPTSALVSELNLRFPGLRTWQFRTNLGFGGAANFAASQANGEFLVLLNDDAVVETGWLDALVDTAERRERCGAVGSTFLHPDGSLQEAGSVVWNDGSSIAVGDGASISHCCWNFERKVDYCSGGSLLVRSSLWHEIGGLDDRYYPAYYEDVDLCMKIRQAGWEVWYQPASVVRHVRSAGTSQTFKNFLMQRNRARFVERWSPHLVDHAEPPDVDDAVWRGMGRPVRVLVVDDRVPHPALGSGFGRMHDALMAMAADPELSVALHPRCGVPRDTIAYRRVGIRIVADLEGHLRESGTKYDVVVASRPHNFDLFAPLFEEYLPDAVIIYDAEALYHRRIVMQAQLAETNEARTSLLGEAEGMRRVEQRLVARADHVVCISEEEATLVREMTRSPVAVVEPWLSSPTPTASPFDARRHIGLVAGWAGGRGSPNADGLLWFWREVMPLVRAVIPTCRLLVTGATPPDDVAWLHGDDVFFVGALPDLRTFYEDIRVAISPVRFGAGVKLKTIEALQYGVPVVATGEGAAGMGIAGKAVLVANDPALFAQHVITLMTDRAIWEGKRNDALRVSGDSERAGDDITVWPKLIREVVNSRNGVTHDSDRSIR